MDPTDKQDQHANTSAWMSRHKRVDSSGRAPASMRLTLDKKEWFLVAIFVLGVPGLIFNYVHSKAEQKRAEVAEQTRQVQARIDRQEAAEARAKAARAERELALAKMGKRGEVSERDIQGVCAVMKMLGATTCELKVNFLSPTYFDATLPGSSVYARTACLTVANITRKEGSPFIGGGWSMQIFAPTGDGSRPIAVCDL